MTFEFLNFAQTVSLKIIRPPLQIHHGKQSKEKLEMWRNQFVHYGKQAIRLYALNFMNPHCKAKKKQTKKKKGSYLSSCWCWCCNRSYLCLWFRIKEKEGEERRGERQGERRGKQSAEKEREQEESGRRRESVCGPNGRNSQRGDSRDSGALTQRGVTLKGMCWLSEVVLLSQMTSASLLKTIG